MAGASAPTPSRDGKRAVDFPIPLIPMIDLLSVLISFLLFTSVWTQVAKIDVKPGDDHPSSAAGSFERDDGLHLAVTVKVSGYSVTSNGVSLAELERRGDEYDVAALEAILHRMRREHPDEDGVEVRTDDGVAYRELIRVMDVCLSSGLRDLRVSGIDS